MVPVILMGFGEVKRWGDYYYVRMASGKVEHHFFLEGVDPSRHHLLKKKTYHFVDISLHSMEGYSRHKTKVKVNNIQFNHSFLKILKKSEFVRITLSFSLVTSYVHNP